MKIHSDRFPRSPARICSLSKWIRRSSIRSWLACLSTSWSSRSYQRSLLVSSTSPRSPAPHHEDDRTDVVLIIPAKLTYSRDCRGAGPCHAKNKCYRRGYHRAISPVTEARTVDGGLPTAPTGAQTQASFWPLRKHGATSARAPGVAHSVRRRGLYAVLHFSPAAGHGGYRRCIGTGRRQYFTLLRLAAASHPHTATLR